MLIVLSTITTNKSVVFYEFNDINGHEKTLKQLQYFVVFIKNERKLHFHGKPNLGIYLFFNLEIKEVLQCFLKKKKIVLNIICFRYV